MTSPLPPPRSVLAIDFGTQKLGLAFGQSITGTARPLDTLPVQGNQPHWPNLTAIIDQWNPDEIVVGLPLNMDGTESELCVFVRKFARRLQARVTQPVHLVDERLSSREARALQREMGSSPRRRNKPAHRVDALAAKYIAESYLACLD